MSTRGLFTFINSGNQSQPRFYVYTHTDSYLEGAAVKLHKMALNVEGRHTLLEAFIAGNNEARLLTEDPNQWDIEYYYEIDVKTCNVRVLHHDIEAAENSTTEVFNGKIWHFCALHLHNAGFYNERLDHVTYYIMHNKYETLTTCSKALELGGKYLKDAEDFFKRYGTQNPNTENYFLKARMLINLPENTEREIKEWRAEFKA